MSHNCDPETHLPPDPELVPWTKDELEAEFKRAAQPKESDDEPITDLPF